MAHLVGCVVMPGDVLMDIKPSEKNKKIILGPGLRENSNIIQILRPGVLRFRDPGVYWIDCHQKRYIPYKGDLVLGIITQKVGDIFRVDIGSNELASLSYLSFEGATKRNRPDVILGDVVYAKVLVANKDMEPELVCIDSHGRCSGMGIMRNGFLFQTSLNLSRKLLNPPSVLKMLGTRLKFEITVGMNGRLWLRTKSDIQTIALANALLTSEFMDSEQTKAICKRLSKVITGMETE